MNGELSQWVSTVTGCSSEYNSNNWGKDMVTGPPKVYPQYGDIPGSWAPGEIDEFQFLELEFEEEVFITKIDIYETYNSGGVKSIQGKDKTGQWVELYSTDYVTNLNTKRIFSPPIKEMSCQCREIRLNIDCSACGSWVEIDAVQLHGKTFFYQPAIPPSTTVLADDLRTLVNDEEFSDVTFLVDGQTIFAHRAILCARSEYFSSMFSSKKMKSSPKKIDEPVELKNVSKDCFISILHYLYTNDMQPDVPCGALPDVCRVADRFNIDGLKALASFKAHEMMDESNVVDMYVSATTKVPVLDDIKENCLMFISGNMFKVVRTPAFERLPQKLMLEIMQASTSRLSIKK